MTPKQKTNGRSLLRAALPLLTAAALYPIASAPASAQALTASQQTAVTNLQNASNALKAQVSLGIRASSNYSAAAANGYVVDPNAYSVATISETQRTTYNSALTTFSTTNFYTAQQFFQDQAAQARTQLQSAISSLASAAVDLQKVASVNQTLSTIADAPTAKAAQAVIASTGLGTEVTSSQVSAYNSSLANVSDYAGKTAAFFRAAGDVTITTNVDNFARQYSKDLAYASAGLAYATGGITVGWADGYGIGMNGVLNGYLINSSTFYNSPGVYGGSQ